MLKYNLRLVIVSAIVAAGSVVVAAIPTDGAPSREQDTQQARKDGDMMVHYYGRSYRSSAARAVGYRALSSRRGGVNNRSYTGGGLRGGK